MELWFLFPLGVAISVVAMSSGVSGSNFWVPVFALWLGLDPRLALWLALLTMLVGFGSGVWANVRAQTVSWYLVARYAAVVVPAALVGAALSNRAPQRLLLVGMGVAITAFGGVLVVRFFRRGAPAKPRHERVFWGVGAAGGFLLGLVATGLGKMLLPCCLDHRRAPHHATAIGTVVLVVFIANIAALAGRLDSAFLASLDAHAVELFALMVWIAPAVALGGFFGPWVARRVPREYVRAYVGVVLVGVGSLMGTQALG